MGTSPGENCSCLAAKRLQKCHLLQVALSPFQPKTFHESTKMDCKNPARFHFFSVAVAKYLCFQSYSLGRVFILIQEFFKDANAFSVSLANQECFSAGNTPFKKKMALPIFYILKSAINHSSKKKKKRWGERKRKQLQTQIRVESEDIVGMAGLIYFKVFFWEIKALKHWSHNILASQLKKGRSNGGLQKVMPNVLV